MSCVHLTTAFDPEFPEAGCPLVVFRFSGVSAFEEFQVTPEARGWLVTWEAIAGDTPDFQLARSAIITVGEEVQFGDFSEDPPIVLKFRQLPPAGPGGLPRTLFWLEDANTGEPIDPCCGEAWRTNYHVSRQVCNDTFNFLFADSPLPSPCIPAPPPIGLASPNTRGVPPGSISDDVLEDRRRFRRPR